MLRMANGAFDEATKVGKERLRDFLADSEVGRQAVAMSGGGDSIRMGKLDRDGKRVGGGDGEDEDDDDI